MHSVAPRPTYDDSAPDLSPRATAIAESLLLGHTVTQTAKIAHCSRATVHRLLRRDDFKQYLRSRKQAIADRLTPTVLDSDVDPDSPAPTIDILLSATLKSLHRAIQDPTISYEDLGRLSKLVLETAGAIKSKLPGVAIQVNQTATPRGHVDLSKLDDDTLRKLEAAVVK